MRLENVEQSLECGRDERIVGCIALNAVPNGTRLYTRYYSYISKLLASASCFRLLPVLLVIKRSPAKRLCRLFFLQGHNNK